MFSSCFPISGNSSDHEIDLQKANIQGEKNRMPIYPEK